MKCQKWSPLQGSNPTSVLSEVWPSPLDLLYKWEVLSCSSALGEDDTFAPSRGDLRPLGRRRLLVGLRCLAGSAPRRDLIVNARRRGVVVSSLSYVLPASRLGLWRIINKPKTSGNLQHRYTEIQSTHVITASLIQIKLQHRVIRKAPRITFWRTYMLFTWAIPLISHKLFHVFQWEQGDLSESWKIGTSLKTQ